MTYMHTSNLVLAYAAYAVGVASPGPSNLAVMSTAMLAGRRSATILAFGVVFGSAVWGLAAAFGLSSAMARYSHSLATVKLLGGLYLFWLALKSFRSATLPKKRESAPVSVQFESGFALFLRGAAMHLTNPKAILVWLSIVALALPAASTSDAMLVVLGCIPIGALIFVAYALAFSTPTARRVHASLKRGFDALLAAVYGFAALQHLLSER